MSAKIFLEFNDDFLKNYRKYEYINILSFFKNTIFIYIFCSIIGQEIGKIKYK